MPHPHAESMRLYAEDAAETDTPWERWEIWSNRDQRWFPMTLNPEWALTGRYRRKPRTITYTVTVPEPLKEWQERCCKIDGRGVYEASHNSIPPFWPTESEAKAAYDALFGPLKS